MELTEQEQKKVAALIKADADIAQVKADLIAAGFRDCDMILKDFAGTVSRDVALACGQFSAQRIAAETTVGRDYFTVDLPNRCVWVSVDGVYNA
jgi:hypothetical protein